VRLGVNPRAGQDLHVSCYVEHAPLARAAAAAYWAGARRVEVIEPGGTAVPILGDDTCVLA
jgi:hypothetical protein